MYWIVPVALVLVASGYIASGVRHDIEFDIGMGFGMFASAVVMVIGCFIL